MTANDRALPPRSTYPWSLTKTIETIETVYHREYEQMDYGGETLNIERTTSEEVPVKYVVEDADAVRALRREMPHLYAQYVVEQAQDQLREYIESGKGKFADLVDIVRQTERESGKRAPELPLKKPSNDNDDGCVLALFSAMPALCTGVLAFTHSAQYILDQKNAHAYDDKPPMMQLAILCSPFIAGGLAAVGTWIAGMVSIGSTYDYLGKRREQYNTARCNEWLPAAQEYLQRTLPEIKCT